MWSALKYEPERQGEGYNAQWFSQEKAWLDQLYACLWLAFLLNDICSRHADEACVLGPSDVVRLFLGKYSTQP